MSAPGPRLADPDFHDDELAADGDDIRDQGDTPAGWRPRPEDLA